MDTKTLGSFYVAVVQSIILFGSETWVVSPCIKFLLGIFRHRVARRLVGKIPRRRSEGTWE